MIEETPIPVEVEEYKALSGVQKQMGTIAFLEEELIKSRRKTDELFDILDKMRSTRAV